MKRVFGILVCFMLLLSGTSVSFAQSEKTKQEKTEETTPKLAESNNMKQTSIPKTRFMTNPPFYI
ncbi:hypothetical protein ACT4UT_01660, partial [Bacillus sp. B-TM1]